MSVKAADLKAGDKIRCVKSDYNRPVGQIETVIGVNRFDEVWTDKHTCRTDGDTLQYFEKVDMNDPTQWQVGDMAYIHKDHGGLSKGDIVKVTGLDDGHPLRGCTRTYIVNAYRVLTSMEVNDLPMDAMLVYVGNYWSVECRGREVIKGLAPYKSTEGLYALKYMPDPVDPVKEERLKRIEAMEKEIAELRKLEES